MDIKAYIESGILEQYVLGKLTPVEQREVEYYASVYPEIREELDQIEIALEDFAQLAGKTPPAGALDAILKKVDTQPANTLSTVSTGTAATATPAGGFSWTRFLAAGMTVKFLLTLGGLLYVFFRNQALHDQIDALYQQREAAQVVCDSISNELNTLQEEVLFLKDLDTRPIALNGTGVVPRAQAAVYVNPNSQRIYLSKFDLPRPPTGKQYQLWAIVNGQPTSMGVFDLPTDPNTFIEVPFVRDAQAFAISLEDEGGNPQPTEGQIYVLGAV